MRNSNEHQVNDFWTGHSQYGLQNIDLHNCAASNSETDDVDFFDAPADKYGLGSSTPRPGATATHVPARTPDDILAEAKIDRVSVVKIDVEGFEAHVRQCATRLLGASDAPRIMFEFCNWAEERAFPGRKDLVQEILLGHGYRLWRIQDHAAGGPSLMRP